MLADYARRRFNCLMLICNKQGTNGHHAKSMRTGMIPGRFRQDLSIRRFGIISAIVLIAVLCLIQSPRSFAKEEVGYLEALKRFRDTAQRANEAFEKAAAAEEEIKNLNAKLKGKTEDLVKAVNTLGKRSQISAAKRKELESSVSSLSKRWEGLSEKIKKAEDQLVMAQAEAKRARKAQAAAQEQHNRLVGTVDESRQLLDDWKQTGLSFLKMLGYLILAGYFVGIIARFFVRFRGVLLGWCPLSLPSSLDPANRQLLEAIPQEENLLLIDENQPKLEAGDEPFHYFGPGFRRFPAEGRIVRLRWKGMFFHRVRRKRWWAWEFSGGAEIASDDALEEPMIVKLREGQDLFLNPDFCWGMTVRS